MSVLQSGITKSLAEAYTIDQSLRFNDGDTPRLQRTWSGAVDNGKNTWSFWFKRGTISTSQFPFWFGGATQGRTYCEFQSSDTFQIYTYQSSSVSGHIRTTQLFRDPSAWYHIVITIDTSLASGGDRMKLFVNGERVTALNVDTNPTQDQDCGMNGGNAYNLISSSEDGSHNPDGNPIDGYLAEFYFIQNTAYEADSFGETDDTTNQWKPIDASGLTFGTNGFYQKYGTTTANTTFTDVSSYGHTITANGGMVNSAAQVKYGSSSALFGGDGSGDYLEIADSSAFDLGTGDFTLEAWVYPTSDGSYRKIFVSGGWGVGPDGEYDYIIDKTDGGALRIQLYDDDAAPYVSTTGTMTIDAWNHVAAVRSGTTVSLYIGGTASGTMTGSWDLVSHGNPQIGIQTDVAATTQMWDGYIAGVRISNSARYTGNFTPSTGPYTSDANTMFLLDTWDGGLGEDSSGNNNTFDTNNIATTDQMQDSPTNNFCTFFGTTVNQDVGDNRATIAFSEGNLRSHTSAGGWSTIPATIGVSSGKWYWELLYQAYTGGADSMLGIVGSNDERVWSSQNAPQDGNSSMLWVNDGNKNIDGSQTSYGNSYTTGDILSVALDLDSGTKTVTFYKNGSTEGAITLSGGVTSATYIVPFLSSHTASWNANFGADSSFAGNETAQGNQDANEIGDFYYTVPANHLALCTSNLPDPEIALPGDNFNTVLWTGNATADRAITGVGFQPDFLWIKNREVTEGHKSVDSVRGATKYLVPNNVDAEATDSDMVTSFDSDGFTIGAQASVNQDTKDIVGWSWLAGGSAVTNTDGTNIDSEVSANTTAGFSICTYTGTGTNADSFGHGLSSAPELVIVKRRESASWQVGSNYIQASSDWTHVIELDTTGASFDSDIRWNDTAASASVVTLGTTTNVNGDGATYVAYCFHSVEGYTKVGAYEGNGDSDGAFVYTGFSPAMVIIKNIDDVQDWSIIDNKRPGYNEVDEILSPNLNSAEDSGTALDFTSNGFKCRGESDINNNAKTMIYIAFAESPFKTSNAR